MIGPSSAKGDTKVCLSVTVAKRNDLNGVYISCVGSRLHHSNCCSSLKKSCVAVLVHTCETNPSKSLTFRDNRDKFLSISKFCFELLKPWASILQDG